MPLLKINNINLFYEQTGEGSAVIFLHGYTKNSKTWDNSVSVVSNKFKTIVLDIRGHGSTQAPVAERDYSINLFSEDVYTLLKQIGIEKCCVVGHSMGGSIALQLVLDHPEMVSGLVLVSTSSGKLNLTPGFSQVRTKMELIARNEGMEAAFEYEAENNPLRNEYLKRYPEVRESNRKMFLKTSVDGYIYAGRSCYGKWSQSPVTDRLDEIKCPVLIFCGENDTPFLSPSRLMKKKLKQADLITVPGVGHALYEEVPEMFNTALLNFLAKPYK